VEVEAVMGGSDLGERRQLEVAAVKRHRGASVNRWQIGFLAPTWVRSAFYGLLRVKVGQLRCYGEVRLNVGQIVMIR
jgi:hypothetical protein